MKKYKRFITYAAAVFMTASMSIAQASENSVTIIPAEGNGNCNDYAANSTILSMAPDGVGTLSGPDGESGTYTLTTDLKTLSFNTTIPMDYAVLKSKRTISVLFYQSGGIDNDSSMTIPGDLVISGFEMCYGLGNLAAPVNQPPVLDPIGDKEVTDGNDLTFIVTAEDVDGLPSNTLTITSSTLPAGASFTDDGNGTGYFEWLNANPTGSTNVTFTVSDGALVDLETMTITVNAIPPEPVVTPTCELIDKLDETGISCPAPEFDNVGNVINRSIVCNMELNDVTGYFGTGDNEICCICNNDSTPLQPCDPGTPAGETNPDTGEVSCNLTADEKAALNLPKAEVTTIIEFNNDPYYCYTSGGRRICYRY